VSAEPYYAGREAYKAGKCVPPQDYTTTERCQWDAGYRDEHLKNPDPIHISAVRNVCFAYRDGRDINPSDIETLEVLATALEGRRK
jgi:hypothetical protein